MENPQKLNVTYLLTYNPILSKNVDVTFEINTYKRYKFQVARGNGSKLVMNFIYCT